MTRGQDFEHSNSCSPALPVVFYRIHTADLLDRVIACFVPSLQDGPRREPISVLRQTFSGVILCTCRMLAITLSSSNSSNSSDHVDLAAAAPAAADSRIHTVDLVD